MTLLGMPELMVGSFHPHLLPSGLFQFSDKHPAIHKCVCYTLSGFGKGVGVCWGNQRALTTFN